MSTILFFADVGKQSSGKSLVAKEVETQASKNQKAVATTTPKAKSRISKLRAISTPNRSHLDTNVTFANQSEMDISSIPVLTPPTVRKSKRKVVNEASFQ